jgi:hypothetical protein
MVFLAGVSAAGRDSLTLRNVCHDITLSASAGYNLPSHGYYNGYNPSGNPIYANSSVHLEYGVGLDPQTRLGALYPGVVQGVGLSCLTFYRHDLMGTPVSAYIFQRGRILDILPVLGVDYRWDLGGSYGWKKSEMIASCANIYVNVGLMLTWDVSDCLSLHAGPQFSHCSNGDTCYPNGGANLVDLRVGITGHLGRSTTEPDRSVIDEYESELHASGFAERMSYDLVLCGGWRAGKVTSGAYALINEPFPFVALNFAPSYRFNRYFSVGASLDLLADRSAGIYDVVEDDATGQVISYELPNFTRQSAAGLSLKGDITMSVFTIGARFGGFLLAGTDSLKSLYATFSLKTFVSKRLFLNVTYRLSSRNYTHNMMYGIGWRFGRP